MSYKDVLNKYVVGSRSSKEVELLQIDQKLREIVQDKNLQQILQEENIRICIHGAALEFCQEGYIHFSLRGKRETTAVYALVDVRFPLISPKEAAAANSLDDFMTNRFFANSAQVTRYNKFVDKTTEAFVCVKEGQNIAQTGDLLAAKYYSSANFFDGITAERIDKRLAKQIKRVFEEKLERIKRGRFDEDYQLSNKQC